MKSWNVQLTSRFTDAHRSSYQTSLSEIRSGRKKTHWMWYIFPQIQGLGYSASTQYYAIKNADEARAFLNDSYLGGNLIEISNELLKLQTNDPSSVFYTPDDLKLRSSMTLFAYVEMNSLFLTKYWRNISKVNQTKELLQFLVKIKHYMTKIQNSTE